MVASAKAICAPRGMGSIRRTMVTSLVSAAPIDLPGGEVLGLSAIVVVATLLTVLLLKELVSVGSEDRRLDPRLQFLSRILNAPVLALLTVFVVVLIVRAWQVL